MHLKIYEFDISEKLFECFPTLKKRKCIFKKMVQYYGNMDEEFEQNYYSRTAKAFYRNRHDNIRLMNWMT